MRAAVRTLLAVLAIAALPLAAAALRAEEPPASAPAQAPPGSPLEAIREDLLGLRFESALARIETVLRDPAVKEVTRVDALALRSQAHAATGALDAAEQDYREILALDPAFQPDAAVASRKAIARYDKARAALVGTLRLDLDPADAKIVVDGRPAQRLSSGVVPVLHGSRVLRLERKGFDPLERTIDVAAGQETPFTIRMVPNARSIVVRTDPDGVRVTVDGAPAGETAKPASGGADAPAELTVEDLAPGEHKIVLSKPCYRTVRHSRMITVDLMDHAPLAIGPMVLDPVRARLTLEGSVPGAELRVDGVLSGTLPVEPLDLCPGQREVEVRAGSRVIWWDRIELPEEGGLGVEIRPRPNLARFAAEWPPALESFARAFSARPPLPLPAGADLAAKAGWESVTLPPGTDLAMAVIPAAGEGSADRRLLFSPLLRTVEKVEGPLPDATPPAWLRSATGLRLADSRKWGKALVVDILPGSPAASAQISVGDRVLAVGGKGVEDSWQALGALRAAAPGSEIEVQVSGPDGVTRTVRIRPVATPVFPLRSDGARSPAVAAAWAAADGAVPGPASASALVNLALLLSEAGRHDLAADTLRRITWGGGKGIGAGTGAYLLGRELEALGRETEARAAFLRARGSESTAQDDEGLEVAPAAADHLADLGVGSERPAAPPTGR